MPSIKQIIAEVQLDATRGPNQKAFVVQAIRDAEERLKLKAPKASRKVSNAKGEMTLEEWEAKEGCALNASMLADWGRKHLLCPRMVHHMVQEFRHEMMAKGKQYANFRMAFMTYLTKGYLSKPLAACTLERSHYKPGTTIETRGNNI